MGLEGVSEDEGDSTPTRVEGSGRARQRDGRISRRAEVKNLGLISSRSQPGLRQHHDVNVIVKNEGTDLGSPSWRPNGSGVEEANTQS